MKCQLPIILIYANFGSWMNGHVLAVEITGNLPLGRYVISVGSNMGETFGF